MLKTLQDVFVAFSALEPTTLLALGIGVGSLAVVFGLAGAFAEADPAPRRMRPSASATGADVRESLAREAGSEPTGLMRALLPANLKERTRVQRQLAQAGIIGSHAVRNFYLVRVVLGLVLPGLLLSLILMGPSLTFLGHLGTWFGSLSRQQSLFLVSTLVALGFFGPAIWLRNRAAERRQTVEDGFPNALDLMQISVEAGVGFDAAMTRVANELRETCPPIAEEFMFAQQEISAGRSRERALADMAERMGVDEVSSFAKVVLQSMQFGTSISDALLTYASEMRQNRELRAQEKANRLPVQMSAVLALLMLPALIMIALAPTVIRYMRYFADG